MASTTAASEARKTAAAARPPPRDFLVHVEAYLARRDGVDKLLKISSYATRLALAAAPVPPAASARLKSFESSVGLSRKAFRLGKFVQDLNALRAHLSPPLVLLAYGGEGISYFIEQFVWLAKAGLLPAHLLPRLQRLSAWAGLLGYVGSITIKLEEVAKIESSIKKRLAEGGGEENDAGEAAAEADDGCAGRGGRRDGAWGCDRREGVARQLHPDGVCRLAIRPYQRAQELEFLLKPQDVTYAGQRMEIVMVKNWRSGNRPLALAGGFRDADQKESEKQSRAGRKTTEFRNKAIRKKR